MHLFIITGVRRGEGASFRWSGIYWEKNTIRVSDNIQYTSQDGVYCDSTKARQQRVLRLLEETMCLLRRYFEWCKVHRPDSDYLFTNRSGGVISPDTISGYMRRFRKKYDLPDFSPHIFRHTMASILIRSKQDIVSISKRLGHAQVSTTQNIYAHLIEAADVESAEMIAAAILHSGQK